MKGTVKRWLTGRGYGFIAPDEGGEEIFLHHSELQGVDTVEEGQKVEFEVQTTEKGPRAVKVRLIE